jgi:transcriptional regulator with XRE-family HTH domain
MTFGERLADLLDKRGLKPAVLALRAKLSSRYINMLISGERKKPSFAAAVKIATALNVSLEWLAGIPPKDKTVLSPDEEYVIQLYRSIPEGDKRRMFIQVTRDAVKMSGGIIPELPDVPTDKPS